jgi:hypothetical protein
VTQCIQIFTDVLDKRATPSNRKKKQLGERGTDVGRGNTGTGTLSGPIRLRRTGKRKMRPLQVLFSEGGEIMALTKPLGDIKGVRRDKRENYRLKALFQGQSG